MIRYVGHDAVIWMLAWHVNGHYHGGSGVDFGFPSFRQCGPSVIVDISASTFTPEYNNYETLKKGCILCTCGKSSNGGSLVFSNEVILTNIWIDPEGFDQCQFVERNADTRRCRFGLEAQRAVIFLSEVHCSSLAPCIGYNCHRIYFTL